MQRIEWIFHKSCVVTIANSCAMVVDYSTQIIVTDSSIGKVDRYSSVNINSFADLVWLENTSTKVLKAKSFDL